jgi:hypothetical protein
VALLLSTLSPLHGQEQSLLEEVTLFVVMATSDNPEFKSPMGFGVRSTWSFGGHWLFRLGYQRMTDESRKVGTVCKSYAPHISCTQAMTHSQMTLAGLRGGLLRTVVLGNYLRFGLGGGLSFNDLNARKVGEDGLRADLLAPKTGLVGYLALVSAEAIPFPGLPIRLTGDLINHWVHFHTCSGSDPPQYDPFCKISPFREVEIGLAISF